MDSRVECVVEKEKEKEQEKVKYIVEKRDFLPFSKKSEYINYIDMVSGSDKLLYIPEDVKIRR